MTALSYLIFSSSFSRFAMSQLRFFILFLTPSKLLPFFFSDASMLYWKKKMSHLLVKLILYQNNWWENIPRRNFIIEPWTCWRQVLATSIQLYNIAYLAIWLQILQNDGFCPLMNCPIQSGNDYCKITSTTYTAIYMNTETKVNLSIARLRALHTQPFKWIQKQR